MPSAIFDRFDALVVPFPFTDRAATKRRPAVVLSSAEEFNGNAEHLAMAMITTATDAAWPLDIAIKDLKSAGLNVECTVRFKLFTLDQRLVLRKAGSLGAADRKRISAAMKTLFLA